MKEKQYYKIIDVVRKNTLENEIGKFVIDSFKLLSINNDVYETVTIYNGEIRNGINLRINSACYTSDIFGCKRCDCHQQLEEALRYISIHEGMLIYIFNHEGRGVGITNKLKTIKCMDMLDCSTFQAFVKEGFPPDNREFGQTVSILNYLGVSEVNLITNNLEKKMFLEDNGIKVLKTIPLVIKDKRVRKYLLSKEREFSHVISKYIEEE